MSKILVAAPMDKYSKWGIALFSLASMFNNSKITVLFFCLFEGRPDCFNIHEISL